MRNDSNWDFSLNHSDFGFIWIQNFVRIQSDWKSRTEFGLALKNLDWLWWVRIGLQISEWIEINVIGSESISIWKFYQGSIK